MATTQHPDHRVLASGAVALLDDRGRVTSIISADDYADYDAYLHTCECELDYNCHIHADRMYLPIERINDERASAERDERWGF
jgi:hypothetical protein